MVGGVAHNIELDASMPESKSDGAFEVKFESALSLAEKHLKNAIAEGGILGPYVAVAMIEAAVNLSVAEISNEDVVDMLRELAGQVEEDSKGYPDDEM